MGSMEMERWRAFFENSGEDLWSLIDWALTIAAADYPQELRARRDGFAEKLFAPPHYPLLSSNCDGPTLTGSEVRNVLKDNERRVDDDDEYERNAAATMTCSYEDGEAVTEDGDVEMQMRREILDIRQRLEECDEASAEEEFVRPLQRLEQIDISVEALKATEIGKVVNGLRKHSSKRVGAAAKRLVRLWKDVVDEWVKTAGDAEAAEIAGTNPSEGQDEDGQLSVQHGEGAVRTTKAASSDVSQVPLQNRVDLLSSSVSSVTQSSSCHSMQMLDIVDDDMFAGSPEEGTQRMKPHPNAFSDNTPSDRCKYNPKLNGYRKESGHQPNGKLINDNKLENVCRSRPPGPRTARGPANTSNTPNKLPDTTAKKIYVSKPAKPYSSECGSVTEKLEAAKKRLHEGYKQAANVKKQRTVQVMGLEEVPQEGHHRPSNSRTGLSTTSRRAGQR